MLKPDGTVDGAGEISSGQLDGISKWSNVVQISASQHNTFGLTSDGVVHEGMGYGEVCSGWEDILFMDASDVLLVGVKKDGSVITYDAEA